MQISALFIKFLYSVLFEQAGMKEGKNLTQASNFSIFALDKEKHVFHDISFLDADISRSKIMLSESGLRDGIGRYPKSVLVNTWSTPNWSWQETPAHLW